MATMIAPAERAAHDTPDLRKLRVFLSHRGELGAQQFVVLLGLQTFDLPRLLQNVERGLPYATLERFQGNLPWSSENVLDWLQIPPRTMARRKQLGRLTSDESDRLLRAARIFAKAIALFEGNAETAAEWLASPQRALGGARPVDFAKTEIGAREVENVIDRLEHGVYT
ncbi:MAG TPA: antitoxin Xre/MbcA/ParS toxin-binding domain-containing protein [Thermoanaerobaculia bacterium]